MITYKEFEVIRTMLKIKPSAEDLAAEVLTKAKLTMYSSQKRKLPN